MVKGNFERRKELAARRKADKKAEAERKSQGALRATPVEVRARLLHDAQLQGVSDEELQAWVVAPPPEDGTSRKGLCDDWWRTGFCSQRRCRLSHEDTISHLRGVPESGACGVAGGGAAAVDGAEPKRKKKGKGRKAKGKGRTAVDGGAAGDAGAGAAAPSALPAMECMPLRSVVAGGDLAYDRIIRTQVRKESPLLFVAMRGELVFDAANPQVFARYAGAADVLPKAGGGDAAGDAAGAVAPALARASTPVRSRRRPCSAGRGLRRALSPGRAAPSAQLAAMEQLDDLGRGVARAASPAAALRAASAPVAHCRAVLQSGHAGAADSLREMEKAAAESQVRVSLPSLGCRRCGVEFGTVAELRQHHKEAHKK